MPVMGLAVTLVILGVWIYTIMDVVGTPADEVRTLSKLAWVAVLLLAGIVGSAAWFLLGRPRALDRYGPAGPAGSGHPAFGGRRRGGAADDATGGTGRAGAVPRARTRRRAGPIGPDDDPEFLRELSDRLRGDGEPEPPTRG